jgi:hypothetical protein
MDVGRRFFLRLERRNNWRKRWLARISAFRLQVNSMAALAGTQILAEERHDVVLEAVGDGASMSAGIDLECVGDTIAV